MNKTLWMVGSYTTGATHYCNTEEEAMRIVNNPDCYSPDDPYVFYEEIDCYIPDEELGRTTSKYKYINTVTGELTLNIWTAIRTTVKHYKNHKILSHWARYHG